MFPKGHSGVRLDPFNEGQYVHVLIFGSLFQDTKSAPINIVNNAAFTMQCTRKMEFCWSAWKTLSTSQGVITIIVQTHHSLVWPNETKSWISTQYLNT